MDNFIGEIRLFAGPYCPEGWALCNGQTLSIQANQVLFAVLGTTYGGDGVTTFGLPNLVEHAVTHAGQGTGLTNRVAGTSFGATTVTLTQANMPTHTHALSMDAQTQTTGVSDPAGALFGEIMPASQLGYVNPPTLDTQVAAMAPQMISPAGGAGGAHNNVQPYIAMNYIIALSGTYPQSN